MQSAWVHGIDVSNHQGSIDWASVARSGVRFAFVKSTEDKHPRNGYRGFVDRYFLTNRDQAEAHGILAYPYHYCHPDYASPAESVSLLQSVADTPQDVRHCVLYSAHWFMSENGLEIPGVAAQGLLWLASWQMRLPPAPNGWERIHFWQHSSDGTVPGIYGDCDLDVFVGSIDELIALGPLVALDIEEGRGDYAQWTAEWLDLARRAM